MDKRSSQPTVSDSNVDYKAILPLQQKRTIAFINAFVNETVTFFNDFAQSCESRLMHFEAKIQKIEATLLILESQLSSVPDHILLSSESQQSGTDSEELTLPLPDIHVESDSNTDANLGKIETNEDPQDTDIKAYENGIYSKFFKMVQVGVPPQAVKLKMMSEGIDPKILDSSSTIQPY